MNSWELFNKVVGNSDRILLYGIPGTGKTYQATKVNVPEGKDDWSLHT